MSKQQALLEQERRQFAELADSLADTKQRAAVQIEALQHRIDQEVTRGASLDHELRDVREQLAEANREVTAGDDERRSLEASKTDTEEELQTEKERAADLADKLAEAERNAATQIEALRKEIESRRAATERAGAHVAEAPPTIASPGTSPARGLETADPASPLTPPSIASPASIALPSGVPARLTLRYALHSEPARRRAMDISWTLRTQGFDVADPVESTAVTPANSVTFFYDEDRGSAKRIADVLSTSGPVRGHTSKAGPLPRPGTIEISING